MNTKAGARHSAADAADMQMLHEIAVRQGATCGGAMKASAQPIKADAGGRVSGYLVRFFGPDIDGDHFLKSTDFGLRDGATLPLLFHHGLDDDIGAEPIGEGTVSYRPDGLWFEGWLKARAKYIDFIKKLLAAGMLGFSSGADPLGVKRAPIPGKAREFAIKAWPIREASLTPTPAAGPLPTLASAKGMTVAERQRKAAIERDLANLDEQRADDILDVLDDLTWQLRMEAELDQIEGSIRR